MNRPLLMVNLPNTIDWLKRKHDDVMKLEKAVRTSEKSVEIRNSLEATLKNSNVMHSPKAMSLCA